MSVNGDASEQVVRLSLEGFEVLAKLTGSGAKNVVALLYAIMKEQKQTKGKTRLNNMLKSGKALKVFSIKNEDLKIFSQEAKRYGILYTALVDKNNKNLDGMVDILVRDEDASRINRIVERFKLTTIDTAKIQTDVQKSIKERKETMDKGVQKKSKEEQLEDVLAQKPIQKEQSQMENFNSAMTVKSPQSKHSSSKTEGVAKPLNAKKSVRKELSELKEKVRNETEMKEKAKQTLSKQNNVSKNEITKTKDTR